MVWVDDIDKIDLTILMVTDQADSPLWKKSIHRGMKDFPGVPGEIADVSVQTIGRRIDALHEAGLLDPCIITPQEINRDLIIAYQVTEKGAKAVREKREDILRQHVSKPSPLSGADGASDRYLAELFAREAGLDAEGQEMLNAFQARELSALIAVYYLQKDVNEEIPETSMEKLSRIGQVDDRLDMVVDVFDEMKTR